jgi:DNA ligase-1
VSALTIQFHQGGVYLPDLRLWLDPHEPQPGPERVFVSHAHSDHIGEHREAILSAPTARLMQTRVQRGPIEHVLPFRESRQFEANERFFQCTLLPAGHIFGSAMLFIEAEGKSLLYTGDFKLRQGLSAEPCEPQQADILIMETTYGRPRYQFPPTAEVMGGVVRFCREALDNDETAVLLGYSLGKSQELLCGLGDAGLPIMLHGAVYKLTKIYEQFGQCFPKYTRYDPATAKGKVLLCPPNVVNSALLRNLGHARSAVLTGWAVDPNCRYRYQVDAAFPLSDHADYPDLIEMVRRVSPKKVYTLHGFAADFAQTLRNLGFDAHALSEPEQMALSLGADPSRSQTSVARLNETNETNAISAPATNVPLCAASAFSRFAETCSAVAGTTSKLEKVRLLSAYLQTLDSAALMRVTTWFTGMPFPPSENKVLQLGWALLRDAFCAVGEIDEAELHQLYLKHSDVGETACELWQRRRPGQSSSLTIEAVDSFFHQLQLERGPSGKLPVLMEALRRCSPLEVKFFVKIITSDLRIGLKEGLVEEAIAHAFGLSADAVRQANLLLGNIGETAALARRNELGSASIKIFRPIKFMLASPEETAAAIWERKAGVGVQASASSSPSDAGEPAEASTPTLWLEDKYDGIRCQLHKAGERVALYSRDLKDITATFHDLADAARVLGADVILDGEIVAMRGDEVLPFAELQRRLGRRDQDLFMREEIPIKFVAFDLLWQNNETLLNQPLRERRRRLESLAPLPNLIRLAQTAPAHSAEDIEAAFAAARHRNNEGLMVKDPESVYSPGRRGLAWLKLKKAFATLDCVVVGAEYGHGKRNKVLSDYTFAVRDEQTGELKTIGKAYSGLTDVEIAALTEHFLKTAVRQHGRYFEVKPEIVLEIAFDRIQISDRHASGLAMRFPRIVRIRTDKSATEIDTLAGARKLVRKS